MLVLTIAFVLAAFVCWLLWLRGGPEARALRRVARDDLRAGLATARLRSEATRAVHRMRLAAESETGELDPHATAVPRGNRALLAAAGALLTIAVICLIVMVSNSADAGGTVTKTTQEPASESTPASSIPVDARDIPANVRTFTALEQTFNSFRKAVWNLPDRHAQRAVLHVVNREMGWLRSAISASPTGLANREARREARRWRRHISSFRKEIVRRLRQCPTRTCQVGIARKARELVT